MLNRFRHSLTMLAAAAALTCAANTSAAVDITGAGLEALEQAESAQGSIEDEILGGLSAPERAELRRLLVKALEEHQPGGGR